MIPIARGERTWVSVGLILPPVRLAGLRAQNAALQREIAESRQGWGQDRTDSSKPPAGDGLSKKPRIAGSFGDLSCHRSGGQPGRRGGMLRPVAHPVEIDRLAAALCGHCCNGLHGGHGVCRMCEQRDMTLAALCCGVIVHDRFKPCLTPSKVEHGLCVHTICVG